MKAFNVNDKYFPFTEEMLNRNKTIETRGTNSLKSLVGKRVGIIRTGKGKAMLVGYVTISDVIRYNTEEEFRRDENKHLVAPRSKYDITKKGKYGYILENPERCEPVAVTAKGIVIRNI